MASLNFTGSLAQTRMKFRSTTSVVVNNVNELFHAMLIFVPKRFANQNIIGWDDSMVSAERPALFTAVVDNYVKVMQGDLLQQWQPIFRQDTNSAVILYLAVFEDEQQSGWRIQERDIAYAPLSIAFEALFPFAYFKFMFDPRSDGSPVTLQPNPGSPASMELVLLNDTAKGSFSTQTIRFINAGNTPVVIPAQAQYQYNSGSKVWRFTIAADIPLTPAGSSGSVMRSVRNGADPSMFDGRDVTSLVQPALPRGVTASLANVVQGNASARTTADVLYVNTSSASQLITGAMYSLNPGIVGAMSYETMIGAPVVIAANDTDQYTIESAGAGADPVMQNGLDITGFFTPALPAGLTAMLSGVTQGSATTKTRGNVTIRNTNSTASSYGPAIFDVQGMGGASKSYSGALSQPAVLEVGSAAGNMASTVDNADAALVSGMDITPFFTPALPTGVSAQTTIVDQGSLAGQTTQTMESTVDGADAAAVNGLDVTGLITPALPSGLTASLANMQQGSGSSRTTGDVVITNTGSSDVNLPAATYTVSGTPLTLDFAFTTSSVIQLRTSAPTTATVVFTNNGMVEQTLAAQTYAVRDNASSFALIYALTVAQPTVLHARQTALHIVAGVNGAETGIANGDNALGFFTPALPAGVTAVIANLVSGSATLPSEADVLIANPGSGAITVPQGAYAVYKAAVSSALYALGASADIVLATGGQYDLPVQALTIGDDANLADGTELTGLFTGSQVPPPRVRSYTMQAQRGIDPGNGYPLTIAAGTYNFNNGSKVYPITITTAFVLAQNAASTPVVVRATAAGEDPNLALGVLDSTLISPSLPNGIVATATDISQGRNPIPASVDVPSQYFDLSLALAVLCKNNISLSWFWSLVKMTFVNKRPSSQDGCWLVYRSRADQLSSMQSLLVGDRSRYYWAALYLLECQNTCVIVHSEPQNIIVDVLSEWFAGRNSSGTYIGNKLSLIRLGGTRIKPLGWPSWLDTSINENALDWQQQLRDMNVGFLFTISDNTPQESNLSGARGVGDIGAGVPVGMQMIAKFVDYTCSMTAANMVTDKGTLTSPILTDEVAYATIQVMVRSQLARFSGSVGRITSITMMFPDFSIARVGRTALSASTAWKAWYQDDLDSIEVSGGVVSA